jgi:transcriptional regulator with XRE-family HTH domain
MMLVPFDLGGGTIGVLLPGDVIRFPVYVSAASTSWPGRCPDPLEARSIVTNWATRTTAPALDETPYAIITPETLDVADEDPPAYRAFKDLGRWLSAPDDEIARAVGVGRTTIYAWKREGHEPRARTAQRLYEYHSVVEALRRRLGATGFRDWLYAGDTSPRDRMLAGQLEDVEARIHETLFRRAGTEVDRAWTSEDLAPVERAEREEPLRLRGGRRRRARLP